MDIDAAKKALGEHFDLMFEDSINLIKMLALPENANILDVGTGSGHFASLLALSGHKVLTGEPASDDSVYAKREWRKKVQAAGVDHLITFQPFEAEKMPFEDASFDAVCFYGVLHHIDEALRPAVLREATRVAKPDAPIAFMEPNDACMKLIAERHPTHPQPADPIAYTAELPLSHKTAEGKFFNATILRKNKN